MNVPTGGPCSSTCSSNAVDTQSSVSEVESDTSCSSNPALSLLDRLKALQKSQLPRKRAIKDKQRQVFYKRHDFPPTKNEISFKHKQI